MGCPSRQPIGGRLYHWAPAQWVSQRAPPIGPIAGSWRSLPTCSQSWVGFRLRSPARGAPSGGGACRSERARILVECAFVPPSVHGYWWRAFCRLLLRAAVGGVRFALSFCARPLAACVLRCPFVHGRWRRAFCAFLLCTAVGGVRFATSERTRPADHGQRNVPLRRTQVSVTSRCVEWSA